jgi:hypothetical protein
MESIFLARTFYKDGYQPDGYEVAEFIDGYQIGSIVLNIGDTVRLERHMRKIDRLVKQADETPRLPPIPSGSSPFLAAMRERAKAAHASSQANMERFRELQTRYAALYAAISNADGYGN